MSDIRPFMVGLTEEEEDAFLAMERRLTRDRLAFEIAFRPEEMEEYAPPLKTFLYRVMIAVRMERDSVN